MTSAGGGHGVRERLRIALGEALEARDKLALSTYRSALGTLDNAEAADPATAPEPTAGRIAGGVAGLGAAEVPRRVLSEAQHVDILRTDVGERRAAADAAERGGRADRAAELRAGAELLERLLVDQRASESGSA